MLRRYVGSVLVLTLLLALPLPVLAQEATPAAEPGQITYEVTIENLTMGQPFSPPVAATHVGEFRMFEEGDLASRELEAIAEGGDPKPMFDRFQAIGAPEVTEVVNVGRPLTPAEMVVTVDGKEVTDMATFEITANAGDTFSIATMLICTNDGFLGLDRVALPESGSAVFELVGFDGGTEENTGLSQHLVDPCSKLGPVPLPGDPDGNNPLNTVATEDPIQVHPGITGGGDLTQEAHGWENPVALVTITRLGAAEPEAGEGATPVAAAPEG